MNLLRGRNSFYPSSVEVLFDDEWSGRSNLANTGTRVPAVNIMENDDEFEIHVAAPGMKKDDFNINLDNNTLTISGESKMENEEQDENRNYTRREFSYSSFRRAFNLPNVVDEDKINTNYQDGY